MADDAIGGIDAENYEARKEALGFLASLNTPRYEGIVEDYLRLTLSEGEASDDPAAGIFRLLSGMAQLVLQLMNIRQLERGLRYEDTLRDLSADEAPEEVVRNAAQRLAGLTRIAHQLIEMREAESAALYEDTLKLLGQWILPRDE